MSEKETYVEMRLRFARVMERGLRNLKGDYPGLDSLETKAWLAKQAEANQQKKENGEPP